MGKGDPQENIDTHTYYDDIPFPLDRPMKLFFFNGDGGVKTSSGFRTRNDDFSRL